MSRIAHHPQTPHPSTTMKTTLAMNSQTDSPLFNLPAELRNEIYSYTLEDDSKEVPLLEARKPEKALLLTCQKIQGEANKMYTKVYRDYWTKTTFTVSPTDSARIVSLDWLQDIDLERITHIKFTTKHKTASAAQLILEFSPNPAYNRRRGQDPWKLTTKVDQSDVPTRGYVRALDTARLLYSSALLTTAADNLMEQSRLRRKAIDARWAGQDVMATNPAAGMALMDRAMVLFNEITALQVEADGFPRAHRADLRKIIDEVLGISKARLETKRKRAREQEARTATAAKSRLRCVCS